MMLLRPYLTHGREAVYGATSLGSASTLAGQRQRRRDRDRAAAEARAATRATATGRKKQTGTLEHHSDSYTAGWERRLSAFDSDLPSVHPTAHPKKARPVEKEVSFALKGWRQQQVFSTSDVSSWNESVIDNVSVWTMPWARVQGGSERPIDIWKDVDIAAEEMH